MRSYRSRHWDGLIAATVRVVTRGTGDERAGTGFFVAPGRVVTCAHVVPGGPGAVHTVRYQGEAHEATVLVREPAVGAERLHSYPDVALLAVRIDAHPCLPLTTAVPAPGRELYAFGCPGPDTRSFWECMTFTSEGTRIQDGTGHEFVKTKGGQVQPGASGSATVDAATGELVGMLTQTRDPALDLGGVLVPTAVIVRTLAGAGHDVVPANRLATAEADTLAGARQRLRWVLQALVNDLATVAQAHRRAMLMALEDDPPDAVDEHDAALCLLHLGLEELGDALRQLARACHSVEVPRRLLGGAAPFALLAGRSWVAPDAAALLAAERRRDHPRIVQLPVGCARSVDLHATRAAVDSHWEAVRLTAPDAETDPATGLPVRLLRAVRCELLRAVCTVDEDDDAAIERQWVRRGERAKARARDRLLVLPAGVADSATLEALRREFAPCLFVLADRASSTAVRDSPGMLVLPESLGEQDEADADELYGEISWLIEQAAR